MLHRPSLSRLLSLLTPLLLATPGPAQEFGDVLSVLELGEGLGGFPGALGDGDRFGAALADIGDLDGDGNGDLAVGAPGTDGGGLDRGAVWILFLNADRSVRETHRIDDSDPVIGLSLPNAGGFGSAITVLDDLDGDGVQELVVGVPSATSATEIGTVRVLLMRSDGTVKSQVLIGDGLGGFTLPLTADDRFGEALASIGDIDANGVEDLAVGLTARSTLFTLRLNPSGTVKGAWEIGEGLGGIGGPLEEDFGAGLGSGIDADGDGLRELYAGAADPDLADTTVGSSMFRVSLVSNGTVDAAFGTDGDDEVLGDPSLVFDYFGSSVAGIGDFDGDGGPDTLVGCPGQDAGSGGTLEVDAGGVFVLQQVFGTPRRAVPIDLRQPALAGLYGAGDHFGDAVAPSGTAVPGEDRFVFVGAPDVDGAGTDRGKVFVLELAGNDFPARADRRIGTGTNYDCFSAGLVVPGETWFTNLDPTAFFGQTVGFVLYDRGLDPGLVLGLNQELLVDVVAGSLLQSFTAPATNRVSIPTAVPDDLSLLGFSGTAQGFLLGTTSGFALCEAYDLVIGI